jgi:hypothetical protein
MFADELEELTPRMLYALCKQRNIGFKYEKYAHALTASAVYNVNRTSDDVPVVSAMDFVRDPKEQAERDRVRAVRRTIMQGIGTLPALSRTKILELRAKLIEKLKSHGNADAEAIFDDCWPSLKPKEDEL